MCVYMYIDPVPGCAPHTTEVNAASPNAIDRHVRVVQWQHWCRDKCRWRPAVRCSRPSALPIYMHMFDMHIAFTPRQVGGAL